MKRYQVRIEGRTYTRLIGTTRRARRALRRRLPRGPLVWRVNSSDWRQARSRRGAARQILADAATRARSSDYHVQGTEVGMRVLVGEPYVPAGIPGAAARTRPTKAILAFVQELSLAFPDWKSLGVYVPRTLKTPEGEPPSTYWSEHAWAAAADTAMRDDRNPGGYETDPARLSPFLLEVHRYILANWGRLMVEESIYDGKAWTGPTTFRAYTGSDRHTTHIHTQTADHNGAKPPWV